MIASIAFILHRQRVKFKKDADLANQEILRLKNENLENEIKVKFSEQEIRTQLEVTGLAGDDMEILQRVVENAKRYYANPKEYDKAWAAMEGDDEE